MTRPASQNKAVIKGRLILFRHGQTNYNAQSLLTGIADAQLTKAGEQQALEAGRLLRGIPIHAVYSSTLSRAFNTAALALSQAQQPQLENADGTFCIMQNADIIEIDSGDFTGRSHKDDPEVKNWQRDFYIPMPNGESYEAALVRIQRFFASEVMPRLQRGETVMVVCHAGVVRVFDYVLGLADVPIKGAPREAGRGRAIHNAAPVMFDFEDGEMVSHVVLSTVNVRDEPAIGPRPPKAS